MRDPKHAAGKPQRDYNNDGISLSIGDSAVKPTALALFLLGLAVATIGNLFVKNPAIVGIGLVIMTGGLVVLVKGFNDRERRLRICEKIVEESADPLTREHFATAMPPYTDKEAEQAASELITRLLRPPTEPEA